MRFKVTTDTSPTSYSTHTGTASTVRGAKRKANKLIKRGETTTITVSDGGSPHSRTVRGTGS